MSYVARSGDTARPSHYPNTPVVDASHKGRKFTQLTPTLFFDQLCDKLNIFPLRLYQLCCWIR